MGRNSMCWMLLLKTKYLLCHFHPYGGFSKIRSHKFYSLQCSTVMCMYCSVCGYNWCGPRVVPSEIGPRVAACKGPHMVACIITVGPRMAACIKKDYAWQLLKQPRVGTSEAATRGIPLALCHAVNLTWATVHYCMAKAFVMRGTMQKMPRVWSRPIDIERSNSLI